MLAIVFHHSPSVMEEDHLISEEYKDISNFYVAA